MARSSLTALAVCLALAGVAHAQLIAYEDFSGYTPGDLKNQDTDSTTGFDGNETWTTSGDTVGVDGFEAIATGLRWGGLVQGGGAVKLWRATTFNDGGGATAELQTGTPLASTTYTQLYFSAIIDADSLTNANSLVVAWDHGVGGTDRLEGFEIRGSDNVWSYGGGGGGSNIDTGLDLVAGVNLVVIRITHKDPYGSDEYELWLNPEPSNPGNPDFSTNIDNGLVINNASYGWDGFYLKEALNGIQSTIVDELRLGETFADVVPEVPRGALVLFR